MKFLVCSTRLVLGTCYPHDFILKEKKEIPTLPQCISRQSLDNISFWWKSLEFLYLFIYFFRWMNSFIFAASFKGISSQKLGGRIGNWRNLWNCWFTWKWINNLFAFVISSHNFSLFFSCYYSEFLVVLCGSIPDLENNGSDDFVSELDSTLFWSRWVHRANDQKILLLTARLWTCKFANQDDSANTLNSGIWVLKGALNPSKICKI